MKESKSNAPTRQSGGISVARLVRWIFPRPKQRHIWKETKRETLGQYTDFGSNPIDIVTMYRVAVHEQCLLTGESRIREVNSLFEANVSV